MRLNGKTLKPLRYHQQLRLMLVPYLLGTLLLVVIPALATVAIAFTRYNAVQPPAWAGLDNFLRLWASPFIRRGLQNTLIFLGLAVPARVLGALGLALLLQRRSRVFSVYRAAVYLPTVMPEVAYALLWLWILNPVYGPLNLILGQLGLPTPAWLADPVSARLAMALMAAFQLGEGLVVILAGLQNIPDAIYEAARVDGASAGQRFAYITLPLLTPWLLLLVFRDALVSLQNTFTPSFVMTYGGPYYATTFAPLLVYEIAFDMFDLGLAAAVMLLVYLFIGILIWGILNVIGLTSGSSHAR